MCEERRIPSPAPSGGYTDQAAAGVNVITEKDRLTKMLFQRSYELEMRAKGLRRLAELMGAAGQHDTELFATVVQLVKD